MLLPRSILRESPPIFARQRASLMKASIADTRPRNWTRSFARQIETDEQKHFLRNYRSKTTGRSAASSPSYRPRLPRARTGDSSKRRATSLSASNGVGLTATEDHRGIQTQIAVSWNDSQRSLGQ